MIIPHLRRGVYHKYMNNTKKRIMMVAESSHITSGFGNYTNQILHRLHATGKYEIAELSCYRTTQTPKTEPWKIYPVAVSPNDPLHAEYSANMSNQYGQWRFELALLDFKPHIVFDIRDFWNYTFQETSPLRSYYYWIINPTYDSDPQKIESINTFKNADMVLFHTEWAKQNLITKYNYQSNNLGPIASDAVDSNIFKPIGFNKRFHKAQFGIPNDAIVIGTVMRNQKRKLIPDILDVFKRLLNNNKDKTLYLYLHTSYPDALGWDIPALLLEHDVSNNVLFTYKCKSCQQFTCSVYKGLNKICDKCNQLTSYLWSTNNGLQNTELNQIYNLFDIYIQYAICEGFGIPPTEAASVGLPIVTIDYGAMGEVGKKVGAYLVDTQRIFREQETNADRCYPNNNQCHDILHKLVNTSFTELNTIGKSTRNKLLSSYSWDKTAKIYENIFDNIDINLLRAWDAPAWEMDLKHPVSNHEYNRDFIYDIIDNVIKDPKLKSTSFIEDIIKALDAGAMINGFNMYNFSRADAIKILEVYANNKYAMESIRTNINYVHLTHLKSFFEYSS